VLTQLREGEEPFAPAPKGIRPEWFFVWMFQTLKIVPAHVWIFEGERVAILGFGLLLVLIAAVPLLEARSSSVRPSASGWFTMLGWILLLYVFVMTLSGYLETPVFASTLQEAAPDELFKSDIHNQLGITCGDCHKDNPQPEKREVAALCARCHSDLNYMRRFNPQMRVDQFAEYQTSVHGMRNARGDENVATCTSCHSVHDIRRVRDPRSPVYPTQKADEYAALGVSPLQRLSRRKFPSVRRRCPFLVCRNFLPE